MTIPSESWEQQWLFYEVHKLEAERPELCWLHAVPNGATTGKREGARLKAEGLKAGVPDLCLPVARAGYHGLYVELKRQNGCESDLSDEQKKWLRGLVENGYYACWCRGYEQALETILAYLDGRVRVR